jgi:xanthine dehydrogenase accessory factor
VKRAVLDALLRARRAKRPPRSSPISRAASSGSRERRRAAGLPPRATARTALREDRAPHRAEPRAVRERVEPAAAHVRDRRRPHRAAARARSARLAGFEVIVIDPRHAFAADVRFPGVEIVDSGPTQALAALAPDARCAIVALTHDPKLDDPALAFALRSEAFYVGALGSRKTHAKRLDRLREHGFSTRDSRGSAGRSGSRSARRRPRRSRSRSSPR